MPIPQRLRELGRHGPRVIRCGVGARQYQIRAVHRASLARRDYNPPRQFVRKRRVCVEVTVEGEFDPSPSPTTAADESVDKLANSVTVIL